MMEPAKADRAMPARSGLLKPAVQQTFTVFLAQLGINASTFCVLALAGFVLSAPAFAELSFIVAAAMLTAGLCELGLNLSATKKYGDSGDIAWLIKPFRIRVIVAAVAVVFGTALIWTASWNGAATSLGSGIALGGVLSLWNAIRATDLARQDYPSIIRASLMFIALRLGMGLMGLYFTENAIAIGVGVFGVPVLAVLVSTSCRLAWQAYHPQAISLHSIAAYAWPVYLNALAFIALPYGPQFFVNVRLSDTDAGTYGLVLTFIGPVSLLAYSVRAVMLPKLLGDGAALENRLWSAQGFATLAGLWLALLAIGAAIAWAMGAVYGARFPDLPITFSVFYCAYSATAVLGLLSLSLHTQGVPQLGMVIALVRLGLVFPALWLFGDDLLTIAIIAGGGLLAGEIIQAFYLGMRRGR